jgi:hypothetical protein
MLTAKKCYHRRRDTVCQTDLSRKEDQAVMSLFLKTVVADLVREGFFGERKPGYTIMCTESRVHQDREWTRYGATEKQRRQVTKELRNSLTARNHEPIFWAGLRLPPGFRLGERFGGRGARRTPAPQNTSLWISASLPGYSQNHHQAVVYFFFGPEAHAASGTYFLEKRHGSWRILWRDFRYYA